MPLPMPPPGVGLKGLMAQRLAPADPMYFNPVLEAPPFDPSILGPASTGTPTNGVDAAGGMPGDMGGMPGGDPDMDAGMDSGVDPMGGSPDAPSATDDGMDGGALGDQSSDLSSGPPPLPLNDPEAMTSRAKNRADAIGLLAEKAKSRMANSQKFQDMAAKNKTPGGY